MPLFHSTGDGGIHLRDRFRLALVLQTPDDVFKPRRREKRCGPEKNAIGGSFHREFGARLPPSRYPDALWENDLAFCGEPRSFHW